ncbi:MAG: maltose alpha-D-glucosyltransferase [Candidatus Omnitrophica bacterium]|nr:maltose alpha-D-glucosyltransferase [Candidatus Omnitrophota bacterium]
MVRAQDGDYIAWLEERSMLRNGGLLAEQVSGKGVQWEHPFAVPQTGEAVERASCWFVAYPAATITPKGESVLSALGNESMWKIFGDMGFRAMHTGPLKRAGGVVGREFTPTVDGWFDRISLELDPGFGTEEEYKILVANAATNGAVIVGDVIPGHTGKGFDFRLAERAYKDYPGLYSMVEIKKEDWGLLPEVPAGSDSANLSSSQVEALLEKGYIPGHLQRVLFSVPGEKGLTGWDATGVVKGADGIERRWVYLHYFRPGQPTLNWLDPSFAANRLIAGDIIKTRMVLGARFIRLDANSFLGIEIRPGADKCWSEGHPLSVVASDYIAFLMRKLGGWSFQELNLGLGDIAKFSENGPDLSYDFITRPGYDHALLTGNAELLKLCLRLMDEYGISPMKLIHAMQNHDEITYELVHFTEHADRTFDIGGREETGKEIREKAVSDMRETAVGKAAPYNKLSGNGLCTTYTGLCSAAFGVKDPYNMTGEEKEKVKNGHLLMALFNAMQPGVFAISGWDLVGALPLKPGRIPSLVADGDYRWINRGAYDIMGFSPDAETSSEGIPRAVSLYGPLPEQLKDPDSFASRIKRMLDIRSEYGIALSRRIELPEVKAKGVVVMVHELPGDKGIQATAINFGREPVKELIDINSAKGMAAKDLLTGEEEGKVFSSGKYDLDLGALEGKVLLFGETSEAE